MPPENVTLSWKDELYQQLFWTHPNHSMQNCYYQINSTIKSREGEYFPSWTNTTSSPWFNYKALNGGFLRVSIQTVCGAKWSEAVFIGLDDPDLQLSCVIKSKTLTRCSWKSLPSAHINFFYKLEDDMLLQCPHYNTTRTSCDLQMNPEDSLSVLLNGTVQNSTIRNVYQFITVDVSLPPLNWTVKESGQKLLIHWTAPDFDFEWNYIIKYKYCNYTEESTTTKLSVTLQRAPGCTYRVSMKGIFSDSAQTEWTAERVFVKVDLDLNTDFNPVFDSSLLAYLLIPLVLAVLVVLSLLWCRKNKDKVFPKVPRPNSELFKDFINNNNQINVPNINFPKLEEECKVILVVDPNQAQL